MQTASARASCPGHDARVLEQVFADSFAASYRTRLCGGADEPLYQPAGDCADGWARIWYRHDYFASALHEIAHWCIAGPARRAQPDYGYWYEPDDRDAVAQRRFLGVEARPQALEWLFARAAGYPFRLSLDNPGADPAQQAADRVALADAVFAAACHYQSLGLPVRARRFRDALVSAFAADARIASPLRRDLLQ